MPEPNTIITELQAGSTVYDLHAKANVNNNADNSEQSYVPYVFDWVGTTQQYIEQNIEEDHPGWVCFITDDISGGATVYTKDETNTKFVQKVGDVVETITGDKTFSDQTTFNKEVVVTNSSPYAQFRAIKDNYGFMIRNDGSNTYFLLTNSGEQQGMWNSFRPWFVNNANGNVTCGTVWRFMEPINGTLADLAENYKSDEKYPAGTLIKFGGEQDITIADDKCNGVISDRPGFILDAELENSLPVALAGKTPVRVIGKVNKFDPITLSDVHGVGRVAKEGEKIVAKALEPSEDENEKLVMCVTKFNLD